jgi:hypothetical protein
MLPVKRSVIKKPVKEVIMSLLMLKMDFYLLVEVKAFYPPGREHRQRKLY